MNKLGLGTVQFGIDYGISSVQGQVKPNEVVEIIDFAKSIGIENLDTAPAYGNSEEILGKCNISSFNITSKTRHFENLYINDDDIPLLQHDLNLTLSSLKRNHLYGLLVHNAEDMKKTGAEKLIDGLQLLKKNGDILKIGVSVYDPMQLEYIIERFSIDLVQLPFNIFDRRMIDSGMFEILSKKKIEIHSRSVFLQGLLLTNSNFRPKKFDQWKQLWKTWSEWLKDNNLSALEASLRYAISVREISKILVGVDSKSQLKEIFDASSGHLPEIPHELYSDDINLLNPSNWDKL